MADSQRRAAYLAANLTYESDKITWYCNVTSDTREVAMSWEEPIYTKAAELCVSAGDHVLECGFGMGILADKIQARNPASHTITEYHPEQIQKAKAWAVGKSNVTIVEDSWWTLFETPGRYDAMFQMNAYADDDLHAKFRQFCQSKAAKDGCKITWWNFSGGTTDAFMRFDWDDGITFTDVTVDPPENTYYNRTTFKLPVKDFTPPTTTYGVIADANISMGDSTVKDILSVHNHDIITCADPSNPSLVNKTSGRSMAVKCKGVYNINDGLLKATGNQIMIIKRDGSWLEKKMNEVVVGDKLYKIDNTEIEVTKIDFDGDTLCYVSRVIIGYNYFANNILVKGGADV